MIDHIVETCPDDLATLKDRLDALAASGATIVTVLWQAQRLDAEEHSAAYDARGSFVIVAQQAAAAILRDRGAEAEMPAATLV